MDIKYAIIQNSKVISIVTSKKAVDEKVFCFFYPNCDEIIEVNDSVNVFSYYKNNKFYPPKPFDSWVLDEKKENWVAPTSKPNDNKMYSWDESDKIWKCFN